MYSVLLLHSRLHKGKQQRRNLTQMVDLGPTVEQTMKAQPVVVEKISSARLTKTGPSEEHLSSLSIVDIISVSMSTDYFILALFSHFHPDSLK